MELTPAASAGRSPPCATVALSATAVVAWRLDRVTHVPGLKRHVAPVRSPAIGHAAHNESPTQAGGADAAASAPSASASLRLCASALNRWRGRLRRADCYRDSGRDDRGDSRERRRSSPTLPKGSVSQFSAASCPCPCPTRARFPTVATSGRASTRRERGAPGRHRAAPRWRGRAAGTRRGSLRTPSPIAERFGRSGPSRRG